MDFRHYWWHFTQMLPSIRYSPASNSQQLPIAYISMLVLPIGSSFISECCRHNSNLWRSMESSILFLLIMSNNYTWGIFWSWSSLERQRREQLWLEIILSVRVLQITFSTLKRAINTIVCFTIAIWSILTMKMQYWFQKKLWRDK